MSKVAATTLILIGSERIARMDFGAAPAHSSVFSWQIGKQPGQPVAGAVEVALGAKARCGKEVWVLCEELWTQTLSLASQAVAGLSDQQLEGALGFELESLSGLGAAESSVAFVPGPQDAGGQTFWVTQISKTDWQQVQQVVKRCGGRLQGICHPAGLPLAWQKPAEGRPWQRIEVWGEFTLCLIGLPDGTVSGRFINGTPAQESWKPAIAKWLGQSRAQQVELLRKGQSFAEDAFDGLPELLHLPPLEGQGLERWMRLWATALTEYRGQFPVIRPAARVVSPGQYAGLSAAMAVATLALCIGHGYWMKHCIADTQAQIARVQRPQQEMADLNRRISAMDAELAQLYKNRTAMMGENPVAALARQKKRISAMFQALSQLPSQERIITRILAEGRGNMTIEGMCLRPDCADSLAVGLAGALGSCGWEVRGAQKSACLVNPDGGPWGFKVMLLPLATSPRPSSPASAAGAPAKVSAPMGAAQ